MNNLTCKCGFLEELRGFQTPGEFDRFKDYLNEQVTEGNLEKIDSDRNYEKGLIYGGEWYKCATCKETWRLVQHDFPFRGLWEKVLK